MDKTVFSTYQHHRFPYNSKKKIKIARALELGSEKHFSHNMSIQACTAMLKQVHVKARTLLVSGAALWQ
jgi:hypothetical protein